MKFDLTSPCPECPFSLGDHAVRGLTNGRVTEIWNALTKEDKSFPCHKTVNYDAYDEDDEYGDDDDDRYVPTQAEQHCAGALILLEKMDRPNQIMRIGERVHFYDRTKLKMDSPIVSSLAELKRRQKYG